MSNPIKKALLELRFRIPNEILDLAFRPDPETSAWRVKSFNLDEEILHKVIQPRVLSDTNMISGVEITINLNGLPYSQPDQTNTIYHIPKDRTQNRSITSVLSVGYVNFSLANLSTGFGMISPYSTNDTLNTAMAVFNSHSSAPPTSTAEVSLIGENTICVSDINRIASDVYVRCNVGYSDELNELSVSVYPKFSDLVELAVKSYIFNTMQVRLNDRFIKGGQELTVVKEIISTYADCETMYKDFLKTKWRKSLYLNDSSRRQRWLRIQMGGSK